MGALTVLYVLNHVSSELVGPRQRDQAFYFPYVTYKKEGKENKGEEKGRKENRRKQGKEVIRRRPKCVHVGHPLSSKHGAMCFHITCAT